MVGDSCRSARSVYLAGHRWRFRRPRDGDALLPGPLLVHPILQSTHWHGWNGGAISGLGVNHFFRVEWVVRRNKSISCRFPQDINALDIDDQFLWGSSFMVSPALNPGQVDRVIYFPKGIWYSWHTVSSLFFVFIMRIKLF